MAPIKGLTMNNTLNNNIMPKLGEGRYSSESQVASYVKQASDAWEQAWQIYWDDQGWIKESKQCPDNGAAVHSKKVRGRKLFKLQAVIDASPSEVFDVLVPGVCEWPIWNPTILDCKHVETLNERTDISYSVGASQVGGLVSSRDFVNLRHWKSRDGIMMSSACAATHPDMPVSKHHIRAENNPACYVFHPVASQPNQCLFTCILNTDLKGWLPQFLIDQAMASVLLQYLGHLKNYLMERCKAKTRDQS